MKPKPLKTPLSSISSARLAKTSFPAARRQATCDSRGLERQPRSNLQLTRIARSGRFSKCRQRRCSSSPRVVRQLQIGVVQRIETFEDQFYANTFLCSE